MLFYTLLLSLFASIACLEFYLSAKKYNKILIAIIRFLPFFILLLLGILKKDTVGYDSVTYHGWYNILLKNQKPAGSYPSVEIGFRFLIETFAKTRAPYIVFLITCNLLIYVPTSIAAFKLSKNSGITAFIYTCLSIMVLNFSALRQAISIGLALLSIVFTLKKKMWSLFVSIFLIVIAGTFHVSGYIFLLSIPLVYIPISKKIIYYLVPLAVLFFFITTPIVMSAYYTVLFGSAYYPITRAGVGEYYFFYLLIFVSFFALENFDSVRSTIRYIVVKFETKITKKEFDNHIFEESKDSKNSNYLLMLFFVGVLFQSTSQVSYAFPRFATPFLAIISIVATNILSEEKHQTTKIISLIIICMGFYAFFLYDSIFPNYLGVCPYLFFWQ